MEQFKPKLGKFLTDVLFKFSWLIILVLVLTGIFFKPIVYLIIIPLITGIIYNAWISRKNKFVTKLFIDEYFVDNDKPVFWIVTIIEFLILLVGLHFLFKGFSTVTGVNENLFNLQLNKMSFSVSFLLAVAVVGGMLIILYQIKHSSKNKRLILIYILVDIFILFPYNFIFSYENCVKDNISQYYANAMPQLYDRLNTELSERTKTSGLKLSPVVNKNIRIQNDIDALKRDKETENQNYLTLSSQTQDPNEKNVIAYNHNKELNKLNKRIIEKENQIDKRVDSLKAYNDNYISLSNTLTSLNPIIKGIQNNKIKKENLYDSVVNAKKIFIEVFSSDTLLKKDTSITNYMNKLQVIPESPTDGFFNLLKDLFNWALKDEYSKHTNSNLKDDIKDTNKAQQEWESLTPQKRWFSFLFSILIDVFPLLITLCYIHFTKTKRIKSV